MPQPEPSETVEAAPRHAPEHAAEPSVLDSYFRPEPDPEPEAHAPAAARHAAPMVDTTPAGHEADPVLQARGLRFEGREHTVFGPLDWQLPTGGTGVVTGQQGSGRSALLLALAGRLKGTTGELQVGEVDGIRRPRALRQQVAVARITGLVELEPSLTVAESRDERALAEGLRTKAARQRFSHLENVLDHRFDMDAWVERLPAVEATLLAIVLGCLGPSAYVVVDDLDARLTDAQLRWIHEAMALLQDEGHHFVVSQLDESPLPATAQVLHLAPPAAAHDAPAPVLHRLRARHASPSTVEPMPDGDASSGEAPSTDTDPVTTRTSTVEDA